MPNQSQRRQKNAAKQNSTSGQDGNANMMDIVGLLVEDRQNQEEELAEKCQH